MTEKEIYHLMSVREVPEYIQTRQISKLLGICQSAVKIALDSGDLPRAARGTVSRAALAVWMIRRPDVLAQMLSKKAPIGSGELLLSGWRDDVSFTVRNMKYAIR